jgi:DNA-directed RNA polymerase subunit M/transcription elongation factor TFIIS
MSKWNASRVAKLRLEIERRQSEARRLSELAKNARARLKQLREELARARGKSKVSTSRTPVVRVFSFEQWAALASEITTDNSGSPAMLSVRCPQCHSSETTLAYDHPWTRCFLCVRCNHSWRVPRTRNASAKPLAARVD